MGEELESTNPLWYIATGKCEWLKTPIRGEVVRAKKGQIVKVKDSCYIKELNLRLIYGRKLNKKQTWNSPRWYEYE